MVDWRRRKHGSPRQIGQAFPVDGESQQHKKGLLDRIRGFGDKHGSQEHEYLERLREVISEHTKPTESRLMDGILTESDAKYLEEKGLIKVDEYTDNISLTEAGQVYFFGEKMKEKEGSQVTYGTRERLDYGEQRD